MRKTSENMGKSENAANQYFLLCLQCFSVPSKVKAYPFSKFHFVLYIVVFPLVNDYLLTKEQIFRPVEIESICRLQNKCISNKEIRFEMGRKYCEKRRKCWLSVLYPSKKNFC